eukprot:1853398-Prymnesium_polylepis.1
MHTGRCGACPCLHGVAVARCAVAQVERVGAVIMAGDEARKAQGDERRRAVSDALSEQEEAHKTILAHSGETHEKALRLAMAAEREKHAAALKEQEKVCARHVEAKREGGPHRIAHAATSPMHVPCDECCEHRGGDGEGAEGSGGGGARGGGTREAGSHREGGRGGGGQGGVTQCEARARAQSDPRGRDGTGAHRNTHAHSRPCIRSCTVLPRGTRAVAQTRPRECGSEIACNRCVRDDDRTALTALVRAHRRSRPSRRRRRCGSRRRSCSSRRLMAAAAASPAMSSSPCPRPSPCKSRR